LRLRPCFGLSHAEEQAPSVTSLSKASEIPILFCFPSVIATAGPHEFTGFARGFCDRREAVAVRNPSYEPGGLLPSTVEAAAATQAVAVERDANGRPFARVGFSHRWAARICRRGAVREGRR
jgi:polyketide synthase 7